MRKYIFFINLISLSLYNISFNMFLKNNKIIYSKIPTIFTNFSNINIIKNIYRKNTLKFINANNISINDNIEKYNFKKIFFNTKISPEKDLILKLRQILSKNYSDINEDIAITLLKSLDNKLNLNHYDNDEYPLLILAIKNNYKKVAKILVEKKNINILKKDIYGNSALFWAINNNYKDIVDTLINKDHQILNITDNEQNNALLWAVIYNNKSIIKKLLECGIDINKKNNADITALSLALNNNKIDIAKLLISKGAKFDNLNNKKLSNKILILLNNIYNKSKKN